ncbi:hypothetical protein ABPG72_018082 [Tetrahymena utriculariae]
MKKSSQKRWSFEKIRKRFERLDLNSLTHSGIQKLFLQSVISHVNSQTTEIDSKFLAFYRRSRVLKLKQYLEQLFSFIPNKVSTNHSQIQVQLYLISQVSQASLKSNNYPQNKLKQVKSPLKKQFQMILTKPNLLEVDEGVLSDISLSLQKYDTQKVRGANLSFLKT